ADWVDDVVRAVDRDGLRDVVLVGHSMGGAVCQAALGALSGRVSQLVLLDSPRIAEGQRAVDVSGPAVPPAAALPPRASWLPPSPVGFEQGFRPPELAAWLNERLCAPPFGPQLDPCPPIPSAAPATSIVFCDRTPAGYPSPYARARC